ncbi:hypothetical protein ABG067_005252 [Albugo candida]
MKIEKVKIVFDWQAGATKMYLPQYDEKFHQDESEVKICIKLKDQTNVCREVDKRIIERSKKNELIINRAAMIKFDVHFIKNDNKFHLLQEPNKANYLTVCNG